MSTTPAIRITEERTFSAQLGERTITGLAIASAWEGFTKYTTATGDHLVVLDAEQRVVSATPTLIPELAVAAPVIGQPYAGGIYAGLTIDEGKLAHLVLLPDAAHDITWDDAVIWAGAVGAHLPTRQELITLYQNLKSEFQPEWHWSSQQHEADSDCAWVQYFSGGYQGNDRKSYGGRARAVRRLPI